MFYPHCAGCYSETVELKAQKSEGREGRFIEMTLTKFNDLKLTSNVLSRKEGLLPIGFNHCFDNCWQTHKVDRILVECTIELFVLMREFTWYEALLWENNGGFEYLCSIYIRVSYKCIIIIIISKLNWCFVMSIFFISQQRLTRRTSAMHIDCAHRNKGIVNDIFPKSI